MSIRAYLIAAAVVVGLGQGRLVANDWIFDYGPYTANAETGERVEQYQKPKTPHLVPYSKFFSEDGPHPYIPYWFYEENMGLPGMYGLGGGGWGGWGGIPAYGAAMNMPYVGPYGF